MKLSIFAAPLLACLLIASPTDPRSDTAQNELRQEVQAILESSGLVGGAYALIEEGEITAVEAFGTVAPGGRAVARDDVFRAGSISKTVTSTLAVALAAEGIVDLDAPVAPLLPGLEIDNPWAGDGAALTLAQLLEHTGGLQGTQFADYREAPDGIAPIDAAWPGPVRLAWSPGEHFLYANLGHTLAAAALAEAAGASFDALVQRHIFEPLGMAHSSFRLDDPLAENLVPSFGADASPAGLWRMTIRPSGGLILTIDDLARFTRFHATTGQSAAIAPPSSIRRMREPSTGLAARAGYP